MKTQAHTNRMEWNRRQVLRGGAAGGLVLLLGGTAWLGGRRALPLRSARRQMMGTTATIMIAHEPRPAAEAAVRDAFAAMEEAASTLTRFDDASDVGRVNAGPGRQVAVGPSTARLLRSSLALARASDGAFDPTLDHLVSLWGFHGRRRPERIPDDAATAPWRSGVGYRRMDLAGNDQQATVRLDASHLGIDLGGIAKGFAVDRAVERLREHGVEHALVEAGGDLYALGGKPNGEAWTIGVRHPRHADQLLKVLQVRDEGVATSGDYENHFMAQGKRYAHVLDPRTGRPARHYRSLTVRAPSAMLADGLATAGSVTQPEALHRLMRRLDGGAWLAVTQEGREVVG